MGQFNDGSPRSWAGMLTRTWGSLSRTQQKLGTNTGQCIIGLLLCSNDHISVSSDSHCACVTRVFCNVSLKFKLHIRTVLFQF